MFLNQSQNQNKTILSFFFSFNKLFFSFCLLSNVINQEKKKKKKKKRKHLTKTNDETPEEK